MEVRGEMAVCLEAAKRILSQRPSGLITDVDGTISPIAASPAMAVAEPRAVRALAELQSKLNLIAVVSGRPIGQICRMIELDGIAMVGNHGLEWWNGEEADILPEARPFLGQIGETVEYLRTKASYPGILIEDKGVTVAVHYRLASDPSVAREKLLRVLAECPSARGLRLTEGKMVIDLLPPVLADKGKAVGRLVREFRLASVVYMGDDETDVEAFEVLAARRPNTGTTALLVAIAAEDAPGDLLARADFVLPGVEEATQFLEGLAAAFAAPNGSAP